MPAIPHRSRLKIKMKTPAGQWVDRLPAMIKYDSWSSMTLKYDRLPAMIKCDSYVWHLYVRFGGLYPASYLK
jgi:hypothetical protein